MELRVLRYFLAVAREESITAAAETLHITQPTLSKQLMELEQQLGKKLFTRGSRKITLTEDGQFLRQRAQEIIDLADKTESELLAGTDTASGCICIGGGETCAMRIIADTIAHMRRTCPDIHVNLFSGNGEDVSERLDKGLIDFGLFVGQTDLKKYEYLRLPASDAWGLVLRKDDPLARLRTITPADLLNTPILCSRQAMIQNELSGWMGGHFDQLNQVGTYNLIYNAALMVEAGIGSAICIDGLIGPSETLCFRPFEPRITAPITLAWKKYQVFSCAAKTFLSELRRAIEA